MKGGNDTGNPLLSNNQHTNNPFTGIIQAKNNPFLSGRESISNPLLNIAQRKENENNAGSEGVTWAVVNAGYSEADKKNFKLSPKKMELPLCFSILIKILLDI